MSFPFEQKPVYIFSDSPFATLVAVVDDYATLRFKRGWYAPGDFELTINRNTLYAAEFVRGRIIRVGEDDTKVGYIDDVTEAIGPEGALSEVLSVRGHELPQWLDRRDVLPPVGEAYYELPAATPAETVVKDLILDNLGSGASVAREDTDLVVASDLGRGSNYKLSSRYNNLLKEVADCLLATNTGIYATLDTASGKWNLEFGTGTDRTASVVFTTDRETTLRASLRESDLAYKNVATVAGQGEGADRVIRTVWDGSEPTGRARREMFVDARDLALVASLDARGAQKLAENQFTQYLKVDALAYSQVVYEVDYFVGDKVTVSQFGVTQQVYITSAEESWKPGFYNVQLGFDRSPPTLTNQVSGVAATANQTLARINPTWPSTTDETLASDSTEEIPTVSAVKGYVDSLIETMPPLDSIALAIPAIDVPDYPDGLATYAQDLWNSTTGWSGGTAATGVSVSSGKLVATFDGTGGLGTNFGVTGSASYSNKHLVAKIVSQTAITNIKHLESAAMVALSYTLLDAYTAIISDYGNGDDVFINVNHGVAVANVVTLEYAYLGDGTYASKIIDASKSNLRPTNVGAVPVPSVGGTGLLFNGASYVNLPSAIRIRSLSCLFRCTGFSAQGAAIWSATSYAGEYILLGNTTGGYGDESLTVQSSSGGAFVRLGESHYMDGLDHHLAIYINGTSTIVWIDGMVQVLTISGSGPSPFVYQGTIGDYPTAPTNYKFKGIIANALGWSDHALTQENVNYLVSHNNLLPDVDGVVAIRKSALTYGSSVASVAGSITPTGSNFHVTGTAAITGIVFSGDLQITIIPDGVFTWTAAGNIALAGTAVVSKALIFTYDANALLWYPSYT